MFFLPNRPFSLFFFLLFVAFVIYADVILYGELCFDDHKAITGNLDVMDGSPERWQSLWFHDFWGADMSDPSSHKSYRPLSIITFKLDLLLSRAWSLPIATLMHVHNVVIHAGVSLLIFVWFRQLFTSLVFVSPAFPLASIEAVAALSAVCFLVHPVHVESVAGIVGRADLYSALFSLLALILAPRHHRWRALFIVVAILFKETAFFLPFYLIGQDLVTVFFHLSYPSFSTTPLNRSPSQDPSDPPAPSSSSPVSSSSTPFKKMAQHLLATHLVPWLSLCLAAVAYLLWRKTLAPDFVLSNYRNAENPLAFIHDPLLRWSSMAYILTVYFSLMLWPWPLSCDYSFNCIPLIDDLLDPRNLRCIALLAVALSLLFLSFLRRLPHLLLGLGFLAASMVAFSNVFFWVGTLVAERLLYLPIAGLLLLLSTLWLPTFSSTRGLRLACWLLLLLFAVLSFSRARHWRNEEVLFFEAEKVCPHSVKVQLNLGILHNRREDWATAKQHFLQARAIDPTFCDPDLFLGLVNLRLGLTTEGIDTLIRSLACPWHRVQSFEALEQIRNTLKTTAPKSPYPHELWARVLNATSPYLATESEVNLYVLNAAAEWRDAGSKYYEEGPQSFEKALNCFLMAIQALMQNPKLAEAGACTIQVYYWIGHVLVESGQVAAALPYFEKVVRSCPRDLPSYDQAQAFLNMLNQTR